MLIETGMRQRRARVGTSEIAYQVGGRGAPLVLIHGLSGSGRWWARNVAELARHFEVYLVDLVGFGASRRSRPFVLRETASLLARWMEQIGIDRAAVVGHSMGGHIAADLAADFPARVERLVLVDPAVLPMNFSHRQHGTSMVREAIQMPLDFLPTLVTDALRAGVGTIWRAANELLTTDLRPKLAQIQVPTLVVWGEHDALLPLDFGKQLGQHLRFEELVVIKGAGHNPMWDRPQAFNQVLLEFLGVSASRTAAPSPKQAAHAQREAAAH